MQLLDRATRLRTDRTPFVLATVVRAERPTSARPGDQALVLADGTIEGFVGGSCASSTVHAESLRLLASASGEAGLLWITPGGSSQAAPPGVRVVDNPCLSGGALEIFLEPVLPPALILVVGDAPVARALVRVGRALDHEVRVVPVDEPVPADAAAVVVAAHGGVDERRALTAALDAGVPYIALVAGRKRAAGVLAGVDGGSRVHAPAGLDIGARTPSEIALSIYAELVAVREARPGVQESHVAEHGRGPAPGPGVHESHLHERAVHESHLQVPGGQQSHLHEPDVHESHLHGPRPGPVIVTDPVCGMDVVAAAPTLFAAGEWFCGPGCRETYLREVAR